MSYDLLRIFNYIFDDPNVFQNCSDSFYQKHVTVPINIFIDADGKLIFELAASFATKDDFSVTYEDKSEWGEGTLLTIERKERSMSEQDKEKRKMRKYFVHKISDRPWVKKFFCDPCYDFSRATTKFSDGVLTIEIPQKEQSKPKVLTIN